MTGSYWCKIGTFRNQVRLSHCKKSYTIPPLIIQNPYIVFARLMESLSDGPPTPMAPAVPNGLPPTSGMPTSKSSKGKKKKKDKLPKSPAEHHNRWTTPEQYELLDKFRPQYLEFQARHKLFLLWPEIETAFLTQWPVSALCEQLGIAVDETVTQPHAAVSEQNTRKPKTATGLIKKRIRNWFENNNTVKRPRAPAKKDVFEFNSRSRIHHPLEIFQIQHRDLIDCQLETLKAAEPDTAAFTLFRRASEMAWAKASSDIRDACAAVVEEEKKEKEQLKALENGDTDEKRTPEHYANALALMPGHINLFASKLAERTGQIFLITSVGPNERGGITSQSWQFGPSYAQVNSVGHTFEQAFAGFKSYFLDQFTEYGKGCFTRAMRENHVADRRRNNAPVVTAPTVKLIDEGAISAPVLTGLVETEDGLDILGPDAPESAGQSSVSIEEDSAWTPDPYLLTVPPVPSSATLPPSTSPALPLSTMSPSNSGSCMTLDVGSSMTLPQSVSPTLSLSTTSPSYMTSDVGSYITLPSTSPELPLSTTSPSNSGSSMTLPFNPSVDMTSQNGPSMTLPPPTLPIETSTTTAITATNFDWTSAVSPDTWQQWDTFMSELPTTFSSNNVPPILQSASDIVTPLPAAPAASSLNVFSQELTAPSAPAPPTTLFALPTPSPIPGLFSLPSSSPPSSTPAASTTIPAKFTPLTTLAWNPLTRILKPANEPPLPPTMLTQDDTVLGGSLMGEKTPEPELPPARAKRVRKPATKKAGAPPATKKAGAPPKKAVAKKATTPLKTAVALSLPSTSPPAPPPPQPPRPTPRPTAAARALGATQPSVEESQDALGRRSQRKRGAPMRELVPLISRGNKENIPPWCSALSLGMRGRAMGDDWDLLVRTYERLEADMNQTEVPPQRLPISSLRPQELVLWLVDRNFDVEPEIKNIDTYGSTWRDWWNGIQHPLRRRMVKSPLPVAEYKPEQLVPLRCGGELGLVTVLLGLFWWGALLGSSKHRDVQLKLWSAAVTDFQKCVEVMHDLPSATSAADLPEGSSRKKARLT
ncbi:hypothetical protein BDZ89DRAFT_1138694 [Hymenopellis radicata]|nr:hypothetical protein BDZ89DRAFT_1138694 [Hymenopellis radicata]